MERDTFSVIVDSREQISTHTLTWSVTASILSSDCLSEISTHTLTWSVTGKRQRSVAFSTISTHTLTWSVTFRSCFLYLYEKYFNSHAHVERDYIIQGGSIQDKYFNSHAHVERDSSRLQAEKIERHFNSHAHVERDYNLYSTDDYDRISTHTLTWSVTRKRYQTQDPLLEFQLTRSRGA